jgi:hypothetical protein
MAIMAKMAKNIWPEERNWRENRRENERRINGVIWRRNSGVIESG